MDNRIKALMAIIAIIERFHNGSITRYEMHMGIATELLVLTKKGA